MHSVEGCWQRYMKRNDENISYHNDVIKWKHFPRYCPFVRGIHRSPVNFLHKGQWRRALMFSLICAWMNGWVNNHKAGDLKRHRTHSDVTVMCSIWDHYICMIGSYCSFEIFRGRLPIPSWQHAIMISNITNQIWLRVCKTILKLVGIVTQKWFSII